VSHCDSSRYSRSMPDVAFSYKVVILCAAKNHVSVAELPLGCLTKGNGTDASVLDTTPHKETSHGKRQYA